MPTKGRKKNRQSRFHEIVAGLVAVAAIVTAMAGHGGSQSATIGDPARCVVVQRVSP